MKRILAFTLALVMVSLGLPSVSYAAGPAARQNGQVVGTARNEAGSPIGNTTVRLRNTGTGLMESASRTSASGQFSFGDVPAGTYVVELVDETGAVIATSASVSLATGSMSVTGVALTAAVGKAGAGAVAATGGAAHFFSSTTGILLLAAAGGGAVAGVVLATRTTSPSR